MRSVAWIVWPAYVAGEGNCVAGPPDDVASALQTRQDKLVMQENSAHLDTALQAKQAQVFLVGTDKCKKHGKALSRLACRDAAKALKFNKYVEISQPEGPAGCYKSGRTVATWNHEGSPKFESREPICISKAAVAKLSSRAMKPLGSRDAFVHLFEWSWADIARECEDFLGPKGFTAVQISPPNDHKAGDEWWARYQPVSYALKSRSGNEKDLEDMVSRCNAVGVGIYADAVINHMAGFSSGLSVAGNKYGNRTTPDYVPQDFHHDEGNPKHNCVINDWTNKTESQICDMGDLADLCTGCQQVQKTIAGYLNRLSSLGVAGYRIDAAKHMAVEDLRGILQKVDSSQSASKRQTPWRFHEVIQGPGIVAQDYVAVGSVTEFGYGWKVTEAISEGKLQNLLALNSQGWIPKDAAVVFLDNHDSQREHTTALLTHKDGPLYKLANVFMLAHPYGYPAIMSSYFFIPHKDTKVPVGRSPHDRDGCGKDAWICEHRWPAIANMVAWRSSAGVDQISIFNVLNESTAVLCRGASACILINSDDTPTTVNLQVTVPPGTYCNVFVSDDWTSCPTVIVGVNGMVQTEVAGHSALAFHIGVTTTHDSWARSNVGVPTWGGFLSSELRVVGDSVGARTLAQGIVMKKLGHTHVFQAELNIQSTGLGFKLFRGDFAFGEVGLKQGSITSITGGQGKKGLLEQDGKGTMPPPATAGPYTLTVDLVLGTLIYTACPKCVITTTTTTTTTCQGKLCRQPWGGFLSEQLFVVGGSVAVGWEATKGMAMIKQGSTNIFNLVLEIKDTGGGFKFLRSQDGTWTDDLGASNGPGGVASGGSQGILAQDDEDNVPAAAKAGMYTLTVDLDLGIWSYTACPNCAATPSG